MKRTRLRRRSKTPPPWEDRELRAAYRDHHLDTGCQLYRVMREQHPDLFVAAFGGWSMVEQKYEIEIHHLFHVRQRIDVVSNLLAVCRQSHDWIGGRGHVPGTVIALGVKFGDGELNRDDFRRCSGMYVEGWLSLDRIREGCAAWPSVEAVRVRLLERLEGTC